MRAKISNKKSQMPKEDWNQSWMTLKQKLTLYQTKLLHELMRGQEKSLQSLSSSF